MKRILLIGTIILTSNSSFATGLMNSMSLTYSCQRLTNHETGPIITTEFYGSGIPFGGVGIIKLCYAERCSAGLASITYDGQNGKETYAFKYSDQIMKFRFSDDIMSGAEFTSDSGESCKKY